MWGARLCYPILAAKHLQLAPCASRPLHRAFDSCGVLRAGFAAAQDDISFKVLYEELSYSFKSTCSTLLIGCPRNRCPRRWNLSVESVAKNFKRGAERLSSLSEAGTSCLKCVATSRAVDSAESTMLT